MRRPSSWVPGGGRGRVAARPARYGPVVFVRHKVLRQVRVSCSFWQGQGQVLKEFSVWQKLLQGQEEGSERQNSSSPDSYSGLPLYRGTGTHV